ncbi:MAG: hypothetical protein JSR46_09215, partial [Verrucomicrobia bacterium]|nr:hypothetical protein [Verrucomicrobiota bacterium]
MNLVVDGLAVTASFLLSCGPSQLFGLIKGGIDLVRLAKIQYKISQVNEEIKSLQTGGLGEKKVENLTVKLAKRASYESKYESKLRDLTADAVALIPFVGAILSWRVFSGDWGAPGRDIVEHAIPQMLGDHSKVIAPIFYLLSGSGNSQPMPEGAGIPVVDTSGVRQLNFIFHQHDSERPRPTVVIFHGNKMTGEHMDTFGDFYHSLGYDVLMPTIGGYPGSDQVETSEESTYRDVEGIKKFLQLKGVTEVGYHGFSIGGSLAFQAAVGATSATAL